MAHKCANCTDTIVSKVDYGTKGPNHTVTKVVKHNRTDCSTLISLAAGPVANWDVSLFGCR
jgi:hypothetical protein